MSPLSQVQAELARYEHLLLEFDARESGQQVELIIRLKAEVPGAHIYYAPVHSRDIAHPQFPWTFQKFLYDCLHDYLCEMFVRNPQEQESRR